MSPSNQQDQQAGSQEARVELTASGRPRRKRVRTITGCRTCRARKVKCDQKRPKCTHCTRHPLRVCEYEFEEHKSQEGEASPRGMDDGAPVTSSAQTTLDPNAPASSAHLLPAQYEEYLAKREVSRAMAIELSELYLLQPLPYDTASLAESFITKFPVSTYTDFSSLLQFHASLVRRCFSVLAEDHQARLLCTATALLTSTPSPSSASINRPSLLPSYIHQIKSKTDNIITGKLAGVGFTLLLCEVLHPHPHPHPAPAQDPARAQRGMWRDQIKVMVDRSIERGGPGWSIGVAQPVVGYRGGKLENRQPLSFVLYAEVAAVVELYACLTDGTIPFLLSSHGHCSEKVPWLLACRSAQMRASALIPDTIETMFGTPRILMLAFAGAVTLVAKRLDVSSSGVGGREEGEMEREQLDFEVLAFRSELELVWPGRLENRLDEGRVRYGGRIWRLATLILLITQAQHNSLFSHDVTSKVTRVLELLSEALTKIGHLTGWLWPLLITACACTDLYQRQGFVELLRCAKGPIGDRDNSDIAHRILTYVWFRHDMGQEDYHIREAIRDDPTLDVLLL
ncbi:hypothetical protein IAR50_005388 [Cryptococcus sp. DSM 104548]